MGSTYHAICEEKKIYCYIGKITELDVIGEAWRKKWPYLATFQIFLMRTIGDDIYLSSCFDTHETNYEEIEYDDRWD